MTAATLTTTSTYSPAAVPADYAATRAGILWTAANLASQPGDITEGLRPGRWPDIDRHRPNHAR